MSVFFHSGKPASPFRPVAIAAALSVAAAFAPGPGAEETLVIGASSHSPSSPSQWILDGAEVAEGSTGPAIAMKASAPEAGGRTGLYLSFDGESPADAGGLWSVETVGPYERSRAARFGSGAGSFRAPETRLVIKPASAGAFDPDMPAGDLSLEFWLKPTRADSGEIVFLWKANRRIGKAWLSQQISCLVLRNRMVFGFINFFGAPDGKPSTISLQGGSVLVPGAWSHHLVRFDSATGLLEYLMNGQIEAIAYATSTGKQSGAVYAPVPGGSGRLELAQNYTGLLDEFRLAPAFIEEPALRRYPASGAVAISPILDLGSTNSALTSIAAKASFPGEAAIQWSYRIGDESAEWRDGSPAWVPFAPGAALSGQGPAPAGRYVQLRLELYPDAQGERTPSVSSISLAYEPDRAPTPPSSVSVTAGDRRIILRWPPVAEADIAGYVVYYGLSSGDYFGTGAAEGPSPILVPGSKTAGLTLNGLKNGTLYFLAVAAYDGADPPHIGELSREISARPSRVSP